MTPAEGAVLATRPGSLPEEAQLNHGFSRFAIELNEITAVERGKIPRTDCRLRSTLIYMIIVIGSDNKSNLI